MIDKREAAKERYDALSRNRASFLDTAVECSRLTLPYLVQQDYDGKNTSIHLPTPWQSVGAKGVVTLASKLMLALLPPQTSFFKFQIDDSKVGKAFSPEDRSELDLALAKQERVVMDNIAASNDRVTIHQSLKHLVVAGNVLLFLGKDGVKLFPLSRYVVDRDGNDSVMEIVTKERISKRLLKDLPKTESMGDDGSDNNSDDEVEVYTHIKRKGNYHVWYQEAFGKRIPKTEGRAPLKSTPWVALRFNTVDGESYGRGRVEEFLGDLKSLEGLMQALVEGSAASAKMVFTVNPGSTVTAKVLSEAKNGSIIQARPEDVGVVQAGKASDLATAAQMTDVLERRLSEAFLILNVRQSERTTAEEVRMTQMELEAQLGGLFSLLTVEFLLPYLNRKLSLLEKSNQMMPMPKGLVKPTIVAGINAIGRGQDLESLARFFTIIQQTMGPEVIQKHLNLSEGVKRLATAQGIDVLNLVKSMQEMDQEEKKKMGQQMALMEQKDKASLLKAPVFDPTKNPNAEQLIDAQPDPKQAIQGQNQTPPQGGGGPAQR